MTTEQAKKELVKRYKYLHENAKFFLALYLVEETEEEFQEYKSKYKTSRKERRIYIDLDDNKLRGIEEFLMSDCSMENTLLYIVIEDLKKSEPHKRRVQEALDLIERKSKTDSPLMEQLNLFNILSKYGRFLEEQSEDLDNKINKLRVLDEYFRLARYRNDGKIYTSGKDLTLHDCPSGISIPLHKPEPYREKSDIGVTRNNFIDAIVDAPYYEYNWSIFTEEEKQEIYLKLYDELPYYLNITCDLEEEYIQTMIDSRLQRPDNTKPCHEEFRIDIDQIFINPNDTLYRYYQMCPHCGYIVNIPKEILSKRVKQRIEERCSNNPNLFRINYLKSELKALESQMQEGPSKILK